MTTKSTFSALGAQMSSEWVHGWAHVEDLALPKSLKSGNFTLAKAVIRWMSANEAIAVDVAANFTARRVLLRIPKIRMGHVFAFCIGDAKLQPE
jgi:hypothetical protein